MLYNNFHRYLFKAALITGCFFISACENSLDQINAITSKRIGVEEAKGVDIVYSIGDKTKARLSAPFMLRHQDTIPYIEFTKTVHTDFYNDSLVIESKLDAHYGKYIETQSKVFLRDSVIVFNTQGDTLYCDELYWDRSRTGQEFYTDKPVQIRTKMQTIYGTGFETSQDFKDKHVINPTNSIIRVPASQFPED